MADVVVAAVDVSALDVVGGASGACWSLPHGGDLDANVVVLHPGDSVGSHVNGEVDVLVVVLAGGGFVIVDGVRRAVRRSMVVHVPKGLARSIVAGDDEALVYVTVHRARSGLAIGRGGRRGGP